jgi:Ca-activated chloride channel family protein
MPRFPGNWLHSKACTRLAFALLLTTTVFAGWVSGGQGEQSDNAPPRISEGSLLYRSPISGRFESIPLAHTDVTLDVRGLAAAVTVTQQFVNSGTDPIEAVYVFPLPHDSAVYDLEIRIGNRLIRSTIRERDEAKRVYDSAKSEGKRAALVEEERPNIFTASVANLMPGDHIDVRLRYVQPLSWEDGRIRLVFPMVVGPRYIPGTQAVTHTGTGCTTKAHRGTATSRLPCYSCQQP